MSSVSTTAIRSLKNILSADQISDKLEDLRTYGKDWAFKGQASLVVFPKSTKEVAELVRWAIKERQVLIPSGGRTGLSGGAAALKGEVVVSFDKMDQISQFDPLEQSVQVQAGVITQDLKNFAVSKNLFFPISFAAEGSSQIGGNIATNAGGVHVLRYGSMKERVLGLEVVTGCGDVLNLGRGLIKNATGYKLMELFIGSEGTLGFITQATLKLIKPPQDLKVFLFSLEKTSSFFPLFQKFKEACRPTAFEVFTDKGLDYVLQQNTIKYPLEKRNPFYILMEVEQSYEEQALLIFEKALEEELITDGVFGQSATQNETLWSLRENISESLAPYSPYKNDIAMKPSSITPFLKEMEMLFNTRYSEFPVVWFGHLGDGNLHINIVKPKNMDQTNFIQKCETLNPALFSLVQKFNGTVSAEHGIGILKKPYLHYSRSKEEINYMKQIKKVFDPNNIINQGKIF